MNINKKYLIMNCAVAGVFGVISGKLIGYYEGKYEGALKVIEEKASANETLLSVIKMQNFAYNKMIKKNFDKADQNIEKTKEIQKETEKTFDELFGMDEKLKTVDKSKVKTFEERFGKKFEDVNW